MPSRSEQRLALFDLRGASSFQGWYISPLLVVAGMLAATPSWSISRGGLLAILLLIDALLGAFWSSIHTITDEAGPFRRRPLLGTPLRLVWPPLLVLALTLKSVPQAAWLVALWIFLALGGFLAPIRRNRALRALAAAAFPWWLGLLGGDASLVSVAGLMGILLAMLALDFWEPGVQAILLVLPLASFLFFLEHLAIAMILWNIWIVLRLFRVARVRRGMAWFRCYAQPWLAVGMLLIGWVL